MITPRPNMIRSLVATLATDRTTSITLTEAAPERAKSHHVAGGTAYVGIDEQAVLAVTHVAGVARAVGDVPLLLAGLPVSIRDLLGVAGQMTAASSCTLAGQLRATADAATVAHPRAAGAVLLGRTNMNKFAFPGLELNPRYGTPYTPAGGARAAGGSTSGDAVTVAGGMVVAALGADTSGSIRTPSAFCNLTDFKPAVRRVPMTGGVSLPTSLDPGGSLASSVDCYVIVDAVLSGESGNDAFDTAAVPLAGLRFGITQDYIDADLDNTVAATFNRAIEQLERAGAHIVRFEFPGLLQLPEINSGGGLSAAEPWAWHRSLLTHAGTQYDPHVATRIHRGDQMNTTAYIDVINARVCMIAATHKHLDNFDTWLMPVVTIIPSEVAPPEADNAAFFHVNAFALRNPSMTNFLDDCALTLSVHAAGGLPVGLSFCGLANDDARILHVGRTVETALRR